MQDVESEIPASSQELGLVPGLLCVVVKCAPLH